MQTWNLPSPPGFQGIREDLPLNVYQRILPHWRQPGATYFVTFRLADSIPQAKLRELRAIKVEWERKHPSPRSRDQLEQLTRRLGALVDKWLNYGNGSCLLRDPQCARHVAYSMHAGLGTLHDLGCYVIMPNHVHAVVRPLQPDSTDLEHVCRLWKGGSAKDINLHRGTGGALWQTETFDRIIRDEEHLWRVIQYIGRNPAKARLPPNNVVMWLNPNWQELGWRFETAHPEP